MALFHIEATSFEWITGPEDDPKDLCLHGNYRAVIGNETFENCCTLSAAALYLLKTVTEDHLFGQDNQIFPCCGFFWIANDDLTNVTILGCDTGIDLEITHEGDFVLIATESGSVTRVPVDLYRQEVFRFADQIKAYYDACSPKKLPDDPFDRNGYIAFWNEWERRRNS